MFDDLIKTLDNINSISVPIEADEKGYIDRQCPSQECEFIFKVNDDDWSDNSKDEAVWCPLCRHEAPSDQWFTFEQIEYAEKEAITIVEGMIQNAMISDARKFNQRQPKNQFLTMSMNVPGGRKRTFALPAKAAEAMQLEIQCEECNSRFAVVGSAYFCPACGYNSVTRTYTDSLRKIKAKRDNIEVVRNAIMETSGKDEAELTRRSLLETCILDGVVAFQKFCEGLYSKYGTPPFNAFQRLDQGSDLWKKEIQKGYDAWLQPDQLSSLKILFQKRHLLSHKEGLVDEKYLTTSRDTSYKAGQRIVITNKDIDDLVYFLEILGDGLLKAVEDTK